MKSEKRELPPAKVEVLVPRPVIPALPNVMRFAWRYTNQGRDADALSILKLISELQIHVCTRRSPLSDEKSLRPYPVEACSGGLWKNNGPSVACEISLWPRLVNPSHN